MGDDASGAANPRALSMAETIAASAAAGVLARVPCHPIDTVKARLQCTPCGESPRILTTFRQILRGEGLGGLYRGIGIAFVGSGPAACLYLSSYEYLKRTAADTFGEGSPRFLTEFACGFGAEAVSCCMWVPIDVIKERLQVQDCTVVGRYRNSWDAVRIVTRMEGLGGLYRGYLTTLGSFGPFSAFYFVFYEELRKAAAQAREGVPASTAGTFFEGMACGGAASALASAITSPFDMAKLRLQVQKSRMSCGGTSAQFEYHYSGLVDVLTSMARNEGLMSLWRGAGARILFAGPQAAITFGLFEMFRTSLVAA